MVLFLLVQLLLLSRSATAYFDSWQMMEMGVFVLLAVEERLAVVLLLLFGRLVGWLVSGWWLDTYNL